MARFYVGQRVKLARPWYPKNYGIEGVVAHLGKFDAGFMFADWWTGTEGDVIVQWDCGGWNPQWTEQLEPIQPEGYQPVEWSDCLWQPEGVAA